MKAYHFSQDFIRDGIPIWWDENDDVAFVVEKHISRSRAATEREEKRETGKDKTPPAGRYYTPVPKKIGGGELPTFQEWVDQQERKKAR